MKNAIIFGAVCAAFGYLLFGPAIAIVCFIVGWFIELDTNGAA